MIDGTATDCNETAIRRVTMPAVSGEARSLHATAVPMGTVTVVLADQRPLCRHPLSTVDDIRVLGAAGSGREAVRAVVRHRPDVLVLDPEHGSDTIRDVVRVAPSTAVLVVSDAYDDMSVRTAVQAGARGYLVKGTEKASIASAIRGMAAGEVIFGAGIANRIGRLLADPRGQLSQREHQIVQLVRAGKSNLAIAHELSLAPKTVRNNLSAIYAKLGVTSRAAALAVFDGERAAT